MYRKEKSQVISVVVLLLACCISSTLKSQTRISSPYSRYGIGSLNQITNARTLGMGGVDQALASSLYINFNNPATYTSFRNKSFVFNGGLRTQQTTLKTKDKSEESNYTSLGYLEFGTPITKWMGASFGLIPYSNVGYNIIDKQVLDEIGAVNYSYEGSGGINQFYLGTGFSLTDHLSVGVNAIYYFGKMNFTRSSSFPDSSNYLDIRITDRQSPGDIGWNFGLHYKKNLGEDHSISLGASYGMQNSIKAKRDYLVESLRSSSDLITSVQDTIRFNEGNKGNIILPSNFGIGFTYSKKGIWQISGDFKYSNWENYKAFGNEDSLQNSFRGALGFEFSPKSTTVSGYWKKLYYRLGVNYHQSYLQLRETQISKYGMSFGLGFPVPKSASTIDLGIEFGQMGTTDNNLIKENYIKVSLGLSIFERWFRQRKYN